MQHIDLKSARRKRLDTSRLPLPSLRRMQAMHRRLPPHKLKRLAELEQLLRSGAMPPAAKREMQALRDELATLAQRIFVNSERDRALWAAINSSPPTDDNMPAGTDSHWRVKSGKASGPPPPRNDYGAAETTPIAPLEAGSLSRAEPPENNAFRQPVQSTNAPAGCPRARRQP
jgi:hypothetical protein